MSATLIARYAALLAGNRIERDPRQAAAVDKLDALEKRLLAHQRNRRTFSIGNLFGGLREKSPLQGLYIFGAVGRGKTMLMDLFFEASAVKRKRRVHFHEFMADVHERVHEFRSRNKDGDGGKDAVALAAKSIADEAWLLCFDEFHVTDIADAMILGRLFTQLFAQGVVVVATSNVAPDDLYRDGLNRGLFLPFIALLKEQMAVFQLDAHADFRLQKLVRGKVWIVPADKAADAALDSAWTRVTLGDKGMPVDLLVKGHKVHVPRAAQGAARFAFSDLCEKPLGASDYLRLAREFHTLVVDHIPVMDFDHRNAAKRFIALIDTLYDNGVKLIASAQAEPQSLYRGEQGFEAVEFARTSSRLIEMGSQSYLALPHGRRMAADATDERLIET